MASKRQSTLRSARQRSVKLSNGSSGGRASGDVLSDRISFFQRSVRIAPPPTVLEEADPHRVLMCDFLGLTTAISKLYAQDNVLPMQQVDNASKNPVGSGAVFEVTSITAKSTRPSQIVADEIDEETTPVILKRSPLSMFNTEGGLPEDSDHRQQAASFIMELRILSDPSIRSNRNIVDLLGIGWEYKRAAETLCPWPCLILERADSTLGVFLEHNTSLPYSTKHFLSVDVAKGLTALHEAGIIHGDIKLDNILVFEGDRFVAKVADFSHAIFDTGDITHLVGGTAWYTAPEWKEKLPTSQLMRTDAYSFGLVFASTILGFDVIEHFLKQPDHGWTLEERSENLSSKKDDGTLMDYITNLIYENDDFDIADATNAQIVLELTLQVDSKKRDLPAALSHMASVNDQGQQAPLGTIFKQLYDDILTIPYHAMRGTSHLLKSQVVRALKNTANEDNSNGDRLERRSAACFELCVCYASGFGVEKDPQEAITWLTKSAALGDKWGRSMIYRISQGLGVALPSDIDINDWLSSEAAAGSTIAFESLRDLGSKPDRRMLVHAQMHQNPFPLGADAVATDTIMEVEGEQLEDVQTDVHGNTSIHHVSMSGDHTALDALLSTQDDTITKTLNLQNDIGDTALMIACKVGDLGLSRKLIQNGADATVPNYEGETCLHHLICFDDDDVPAAAELLITSGVDTTIDASGSSLKSEYDIRPDASGCPKIRAILNNRPSVLDTLLRHELQLKSTMNEAASRRHRIAPKKMLAWACRTSNYTVLNVLQKHLPELFKRKDLDSFEIWIEGRRYSLPALLISGCSGDKFGSGFRFPETFQRCLAYGASEGKEFEGTVGLFLDSGVNFHDAHCFGRRNALFYAIEQAREDVVYQLLKQSDFEDPLAVFGSSKPIPPPTENKRPKWYPMYSGPGPNHRRKESLTNAISLSIEQGNRAIFRNLLQFHDREALDRGDQFWIKALDRDHSERLKYSSLKGVRRGLDQQGPPKALHFFPKVKHAPVDLTDSRIETLVPVSECSKSFRKSPLSDGRINYALLFMSWIASSSAHDLALADILLDELAQKGESPNQGWAVQNLVEQNCLIEALFSPLLVSSLHGWEELCDLLLNHGAEPNFQIFGMGEETMTVFNFLLDQAHESESRKKHQKFSDDQIYNATLRLLKAILKQNPKKPRLSSSDILLLVGSYENFHKLQSQEIWTLIEGGFQQSTYFNKAYVRAIGKLAVEKCNPHALEMALKLGFPVNGSTWNIIFETPLDKVKERSRRSGSTCEAILLRYKARRSLVYTIEVQVIGNLLYLALVGAFVYGVFGTIELQHNACISMITGWQEDMRKHAITPWAFIFRVPFAYSPFIPFIATLLIIFIATWAYIDDMGGSTAINHLTTIMMLFLGFSAMTLYSTAHSSESDWYGPTYMLIRPIIRGIRNRRREKRKRKQAAAKAEKEAKEAEDAKDANVDLEAAMSKDEKEEVEANDEPGGTVEANNTTETAVAAEEQQNEKISNEVKNDQ